MRRSRDWLALFLGVAAWRMGLAALLLFLFAFFWGSLLPPKEDWLWLFLVGLVPQAVGHTTVNWAVAASIMGEPVGAALWAFVLFGEGIGLGQGIGIFETAGLPHLS